MIAVTCNSKAPTSISHMYGKDIVLLMAGLVTIALVPACNQQPAASANNSRGLAPSPIAVAYANLRSWPGLANADHQLLRENIADLGSATPSETVLLPLPDSTGYVLVTHFFWSVAICYLGDDLSVRDVASFPSKSGYTICWYDGLVVLIHNHPGTDMSYTQPVSVCVQDGKLVIDDVSDEQCEEIFDHITSNTEEQ